MDDIVYHQTTSTLSCHERILDLTQVGKEDHECFGGSSA